jgi:hypothetical protein
LGCSPYKISNSPDVFFRRIEDGPTIETGRVEEILAGKEFFPVEDIAGGEEAGYVRRQLRGSSTVDPTVRPANNHGYVVRKRKN